MSTSRSIIVVTGVVFVVLSLLGFLVIPATGVLFGLFPMNTALKIVYLVGGVVLALAGATEGISRSTAAVAAVVFIALGVLGFISPNFFGLMPIDSWNIVLHLLAALVMLYAWLAEPEASRTART